MPSRPSNEPESPVVVIGASGTMGREAVLSLLSRSARVRVLTRSLERVESLPSAVERIVGDAARPADLDRALYGARGVFYASPHSSDEVQLAHNVAEAVEKAGVRLVFAGVHIDGGSRLFRALLRAVMGLQMRRYRGKLRASEVARQAPSSVVLMPTNFNQNDELFREAILAGTFPEPLGHGGVNRVDVRDVGDAAARALLDPALPAGAYPVVGPSSLTGPECAAVWAEALGREVRYTGDGDEWIGHVESKLEGHKRDDFLASFRFIRGFRLPTDLRELSRTTTLLGRPPRSYAQYVRDTLERWRASQTA